MGRPKKYFPCTCCDKKFKRIINLQKHMSCHSDSTGQSRSIRIRSNWCHVCRQRFSKSEYQLHIITEHKYDSYEMDTDNSDSENEIMQQNKDLTLSSNEDIKKIFISESEYILPNKDIKKEITTAKSPRTIRVNRLQFDSTCLPVKIKPEPPDVYESNTTTQFIICKKCGMRCKGQRGLNIHLSTTHKRKTSNNYKTSSRISKTEHTVELKEDPDEVTEHYDSHNLPFYAYDAHPNLCQNAQTGLIYNMIPVQCHSVNNLIGIGNQPNLQIFPFLGTQHQLSQQSVETIPKFDHDSQNYIKWLKKFINKCKMHKYPLTPMLCQSVSHINEEITDALANPVGSMKKRSIHYYFMKIKCLLSEIMLGHMRYSLNVVRR